MKRGGPMKLLLAEDEKRMAEALGEILALEGYDVDLAADGEEALAAARRGVYDILVLDVMMPKINGFELTARLRALTRRKEDYHRNLLSYGDIVLNPSTAELICKRSGQSVRLSRKEYRILEYMIANQGLILSREQLAVKIWGYDSEAEYNNADFYDYEIAAGAVGVYKDSEGNYISSVTIDGNEVSLSDGLWGAMPYSAITSLAEADMALAFEYYLNPDYSFNTDFQKQTAEYLAAEYMEYINGRKLSVNEAAVGFDLNGDGEKKDDIALTIEYDDKGHEDTNGYYGSYVDLYLAEFEQSLNDYIARLDYTEDWTWFGSDGQALSDSQVASMTTEDRARAFIEGRYAKGSTGSDSGMGGPGGNGGPPDMNGGGPGGSDGDNAGGPPDMNGGPGQSTGDSDGGSTDMAGQSSEAGNTELVGTPDAGTTQSAGSSVDSANYTSFEEMLAAYQTDIAELEAGDAYGNNIVDLYNPINYIGAEGTEGPTWVRILMGASEGDISMMNSLNMQIGWLAAGTDAEIEWQWDGGHVPSEILGDSLPLYVDMMYGKYVDGAVEVTKAAAKGQTANGTATETDGTDLSGWVSYDADKGASFSLADGAAYRTAGASKSIPGFDVMDYGQEDYVFGSSTADARHWSRYVLDVFEANQDVLADLFN